jgi:dynein heavy chain
MMNELEWRYLLAGPSGDIKTLMNPTNWISENAWPDFYRNLYGLNLLPNFVGIEDHFMKNQEDFKKIFDSSSAHSEPLPDPWEEKLSLF